MLVATPLDVISALSLRAEIDAAFLLDDEAGKDKESVEADEVNAEEEKLGVCLLQGSGLKSVVEDVGARASGDDWDEGGGSFSFGAAAAAVVEMIVGFVDFLGLFNEVLVCGMYPSGRRILLIGFQCDGRGSR